MEKNKENYLIYVLIFCVVLAFGGGYLLGNSMTKGSNTIENKDSNEIKEDNLVVDALGRELFDKFYLKNKNDNYIYLFSGKDTNFNNTNYDNKLIYALLKSDYSIVNNDTDIDEEKIQFKVNLVDLEKIYFEYFHSTISFEFKTDFDFNFYEPKSDNLFGNCVNDNNQLVCNLFWGGGITGYNQYIKYDYSKLNDNKLEVYVKYLLIDAEYGLFSDRNKTNSIDKNIKDINYNDIDKLFSNYEDKTGIYKMVFEKDTDGNYYWVETDVVKK